MDFNVPKQMYQRYNERGKELSRKINAEPDSMMVHIHGNLICLMNVCVVRMQIGTPWEEVKRDYLFVAHNLLTYFALIEKHPEFANGEAKSAGYFPDKNNLEIEGYISHAKSNLPSRRQR